ncbi:MAG: hypothetical protein AAGD09_19875 [Cyanobacteria bacterium P01_F01_bin.56]
MHANRQEIRDIVYLDFEKAASIWSQVKGGLPEKTAIAEDSEKSTGGGAGVGSTKVTGELSKKKSILEERTLHQDILNSVENELTIRKLVIDLKDVLQKDESSPENIRSKIQDACYIKAEGYSTIENYGNIIRVSKGLGGVVDFILNGVIESERKKNPRYFEILEKVKSLKQKIKREKDRNKKATLSNMIKPLEDEFERIQEEISDIANKTVKKVDEWMLDGIQNWIGTFMKTRINLRVYPFQNCPSFQVICNLKKDCFVDDDLQHLLYGYGSIPNVKVAVLGLVTSMPLREGLPFDPMSEFSDLPASTKTVELERAFRQVHFAVDELESYMRFSRYPNITIHPIAVYRILRNQNAIQPIF